MKARILTLLVLSLISLKSIANDDDPVLTEMYSYSVIQIGDGDYNFADVVTSKGAIGFYELDDIQYIAITPQKGKYKKSIIITVYDSDLDGDMDDKWRVVYWGEIRKKKIPVRVIRHYEKGSIDPKTIFITELDPKTREPVKTTVYGDIVYIGPRI